MWDQLKSNVHLMAFGLVTCFCTIPTNISPVCPTITALWNRTLVKRARTPTTLINVKLKCLWKLLVCPHIELVLILYFSNILQTGAEDGCIRLFEILGEGVVFDRSLDPEEHRVISLAWHKSDEVIVTGSINTIRIWNVATGKWTYCCLVVFS